MEILISFFNKIPILVLLILSSLSVISGDLFAKLWSTEQKAWMLTLAILGYFLSGFFYIPSLLREGLVVTSIIWSILSIIGFLVVGFVVFKEPITGMQIIGVSVGIIALIILIISTSH